jgi:hypothetical protein
MKYKNIIKLRLPEIQLLAVVPTQLKFSVVKDHDEPKIFLSETLFCMWECFNMGTELPTKVMLGRTLVLMQMTFSNNVRKVGRLVLSRTSRSACDLATIRQRGKIETGKPKITHATATVYAHAAYTSQNGDIQGTSTRHLACTHLFLA